MGTRCPGVAGSGPLRGAVGQHRAQAARAPVTRRLTRHGTQARRSLIARTLHRRSVGGAQFDPRLDRTGILPSRSCRGAVDDVYWNLVGSWRFLFVRPTAHGEETHQQTHGHPAAIGRLAKQRDADGLAAFEAVEKNPLAQHAAGESRKGEAKFAHEAARSDRGHQEAQRSTLARRQTGTRVGRITRHRARGSLQEDFPLRFEAGEPDAT